MVPGWSLARDPLRYAVAIFGNPGSAGWGWRFAGSTEPRQPHYYHVQGSRLLAEYDNTERDANHVHTVWRDPHGDFGRDILAEHYATSHH